MTATDHALELVRTAARAASDKLADEHRRLRRQRAARHHRRLPARLRLQRAAGQGDRRRGRGQAPRDRRQADPPRGRARRSLGAHRLRRDRRARAARGGAAVLRPRAAVARLPGHRAARRRHLGRARLSAAPHPDQRSAVEIAETVGSRRLVLLRHGRTAWNLEGRAQGHSDVTLDDTGRGPGGRGRAVPRPAAPAALWSSDLARARETASYVEAATGLVATHGPAAAGVRRGGAGRADRRGVRGEVPRGARAVGVGPHHRGRPGRGDGRGRDRPDGAGAARDARLAGARARPGSS